jgi:hypothetical protein
MFDHDEVVIRTNGKVAKKEFGLFGHLSQKVRQQIQDAEDKEIFRILDLLANNQE